MAEKDEKNKEGFFQKVKHFFVHDKKTDDEYDRSILNPEPSKDVNVSRPIPTGETFASNVHSKNFDTNYKDLDQPGTSRVRPISDVNTESNQDMIEKGNVEHSGTRAKPTTGITGVNEHNLQMGEPYVHHVGHSKPISSRDNKDFENTDKKDKNKPKKNKSGSNLTEKDKEYEKSHKKDKNKLGESKPKKNKSGSNLSEGERRRDEHQLGGTNPLSSGSSLGSNDTHVFKDTQQSNLGSNLNQIPSSRINQMPIPSSSPMPIPSNVNQMDQMPSSSINQMPLTSSNQMNQMPLTSSNQMNQMPNLTNLNQMPIPSNMNQMDQIPSSNMNQMPLSSSNQINQMPNLTNLNQMPFPSNMNQMDQMPSSSINQMPIPSSNLMNQMPILSNMNQMDQIPSSSINQIPITSSNQIYQIPLSNLNQFPTPIQDAVNISIDQNKNTLGETFVTVEKGVGKDTDVHIYLNDQNPQSQNTRN